jgi:hypothetical protein
MKKRPPASIFDVMTLFLKSRYWFYWIIVGLLCFAFSEIMARSFGMAEEYFLWDRILAVFAIATIPTFNIWARSNFIRAMAALSNLLRPGDEPFEQWLERQEARAFTLKSWYARFFIGTMTTLGLFTVLTLGLPFKSWVLNAIAVVGFGWFLTMCAQTVYTSFYLLITLGQFVRGPLHAPFYMMFHPAISILQNYFMTSAFTISILYAGLVAGVWQGPYGFNAVLVLWLSAVAFYPISLFSISLFQVHILLQRGKQKDIEAIGEKIQTAFQSLKSAQSLEDIERLEKLMTLQEKVNNMREWSFDVVTAITLIAALTATLVQIGGLILGVLKS